MTELLTRAYAARTRVEERTAASPLWLRGSLAALWAVALGVAALVVVVLVVWAADSRSGASAGEAIRTGLQVWLLGHKVPLHVAGGSIAVAPLGLTLGLGFLVARAAAVVARGQEIDRPFDVARTAAAVGVPYAVLCTFVAAAANSTPVRPDPVVALAAGAVVGCTAAAWGAARGGGLVRATWALLPDRIRVPLGAGAAALAVVAATGLVVVLGSLAVHVSTAADLAGSLGGGLVGTAALVVIDLALIPNAVGCVLGYVAGPGFAVGAGTSVTLSGATVHQVPALPVLGGLPQGGASLPVELLAVAALLAAGALAGRRVARARCATREALLLAGGAGAAAGVLAAVVVAVAGGPAGPGAMSAVGASPWQTGLALAGEVGLVAVATTAVLRLRAAASR